MFKFKTLVLLGFLCFIYQHVMSLCKMSRRDLRQGSPVHKSPHTKKTHHLLKRIVPQDRLHVTCNMSHVTSVICYVT